MYAYVKQPGFFGRLLFLKLTGFMEAVVFHTIRKVFY